MRTARVIVVVVCVCVYVSQRNSLASRDFCACACGRYSVTLSARCFRLLSSMCRTSEIDGQCVHLQGSDRCEISYAATLTRSMCRSTFEDPIGVNFIIMLLYSCTRINPMVCTLVLFIITANLYMWEGVDIFHNNLNIFQCALIYKLIN